MSFIDLYKELCSAPEWDQALLKRAREATNTNENEVPTYTLPSATMGCSNGFDWLNGGRQKTLKMFCDTMFGRILPRPGSLRFEVLSERDDALDGIAIRKEVRIHAAMANGKQFSFDALLYVPKSARTKPVAGFCGLNFNGNHVCTDEKDVAITGNQEKHRDYATDEWRGKKIDLWYFRETVKRGYASMTACYNDIFPDDCGSWANSALALFEDNLEGFSGTHEHYTAIGVWAWGLSRMLDYLETEPLVDATRIAVHGLSRLGKTALWAGAIDQRWAIVISNCSGNGGAALTRRLYGETMLVMSTYFKHWLIKKYHSFIGHEDEMPYDQHQLIALAAPRPVVVASATEDSWADPLGEFLAAKAASEVYALFGSKGLPVNEMPAPDKFVTGDISYHIRTGVHSQQPLDWEHYIEIADRYLQA